MKRLLANPAADTDEIMRSLGISTEDRARAAEIRERISPKMNRMMPGMGGMETTAVAKDERDFADAVLAIENTVANVGNYRRGLAESPRAELDAIVRGLNGGYIAPSPGGDFIANPNTVPTGRNMYSINAEATPSQAAWERASDLGRKLLAEYQKNHDGNYPSKVSFTLWSGSFIESEGTTVAQILWMLGVEPIRDQFGRVLDVRLVPEAELGRPRIDVVVQTSGQFRDLAASRLSLMQRAIDMAASAGDSGENYVLAGKNRAEQVLLEKGFTPHDARDLATTRIFGGVNGMVGTGITGMIESGSRWEDESEIARMYLNNMGAAYGNEKTWGDFRAGVFEAALQNTNIVVQPRQSNTWGALSLDHVYEFMGGPSLTVRHVTGTEPEAYFNDLRNRYNVRVQDLRSAIGVESRATLFNPVYIKENMKGGSAAGFTELVRNTYGWSVMKPEVIDGRMWDQIYDVYVQDGMGLGTHGFFEAQSPAALQEMTAIMLETARKGYWKASPEQLRAAQFESLARTPFTDAVRSILSNPRDKASVNHIISKYKAASEKELGKYKMLIKLGPILGLMGTLIPMGPALAGLSSGDIGSMAYNMQIVFATTVLGLVCGGVGFVLLQIKQRWANTDLEHLDYIANLLSQCEPAAAETPVK